MNPHFTILQNGLKLPKPNRLNELRKMKLQNRALQRNIGFHRRHVCKEVRKFWKKNLFAVVALRLWRGQLTFKIVGYGNEYQDAVVELWRKCNLVVPRNDPVEDIEKKMRFQPNLFFVGLLDGKVVGSIMVGYEGHRGWINYLAVTTESQGQGYGGKLVQKALDELKRLGCQKINLQVRKSNVKVIGFYKHIGFKEDDVVSLGMRLNAR